MNLLLLLSGCICIVLHEVNGHRNGAPDYVCDSMTPSHGANAQNSQSPLKLTVKSQNEQFEVTITAQSGDYFRGFFIQARDADNRDILVDGEFSAAKDGKFVECNGGEKNAITHTNNNDKTVFTTTWRPLAGSDRNIIFRATIVRTAKVFWTHVDSAVFHISPSQPQYPYPTTQKPENELLNYEKCGTERGCFGIPENCLETKKCTVLLSYFYDDSRGVIEFEISRKTSSEGWISAGISEDDKMGSDSVGDCILVGGRASFHYSWNDGKSNKIMNQISQIRGLSASDADGILNCRWVRELNIIEHGIDFDISTKNYYLLLATGPMKSISPLEKGIHNDRMPSKNPVNLTSVSLVVGGSSSAVLIKAHGSLMVIAWAGLVSIGILLARYYKDAWNEKTLCNVKIWFAFHRGLMVISVMMIITAFILVFVHVGGWSSSAVLHAVLGCFSTAFGILQPIGALFRPGPTDSKRPIFNWLHWIGGNTGHILAFAAMFISYTLPAASLPSAFLWVLTIFVVYYILFHVLIQVYVWQLEKRKKNEINMMELSGEKVEEKHILGMTFKQKLLTMYVVPSVGLVITLVLIICLQ